MNKNFLSALKKTIAKLGLILVRIIIITIFGVLSKCLFSCWLVNDWSLPFFLKNILSFSSIYIAIGSTATVFTGNLLNTMGIFRELSWQDIVNIWKFVKSNDNYYNSPNKMHLTGVDTKIGDINSNPLQMGKSGNEGGGSMDNIDPKLKELKELKNRVTKIDRIGEDSVLKTKDKLDYIYKIRDNEGSSCSTSTDEEVKQLLAKELLKNKGMNSILKDTSLSVEERCAIVREWFGKQVDPRPLTENMKISDVAKHKLSQGPSQYIIESRSRNSVGANDIPAFNTPSVRQVSDPQGPKSQLELSPESKGKQVSKFNALNIVGRSELSSSHQGTSSGSKELSRDYSRKAQASELSDVTKDRGQLSPIESIQDSGSSKAKLKRSISKVKDFFKK